MRVSVHLSAFLLALVACDSKKESPAQPSASATREPVAQPSNSQATPASHTAAPTVSASASPSAAPSASAAAGTAPCPANAKRYEEPKFCVVLPENTLDVTYEGDEKEGHIELEPKIGGVLRFSWVPVARAGKESLKTQLEKVDEGYQLAGSGDIPGGAWSDWKKSGDEKNQHVVQSALKTQKLLINCNYSVEETHADQAREICTSVRGF